MHPRRRHGLAAQHAMPPQLQQLAPDRACSSDPTRCPRTHRFLFRHTQTRLPVASRNSNPNPNPTSIQIPPGLAGSESENSYTNRMGMSKDYKK